MTCQGHLKSQDFELELTIQNYKTTEPDTVEC